MSLPESCAAAPPKPRKSMCKLVEDNKNFQGVHLVPGRLTADDLEYINTITCGNFTELIRTRRKGVDEIILAKAFDPYVWRAEYLYSAELRFLKTVQGPWILKFIGYIEDVAENFLLLEYLPDGNLLQLAKAHHLQERQIKLYAAEMFMAVDFIHENGFMHRNVMLSNFLVHGSGHLKLADFGLSYQFRTEEKKQKKVTSPVFATTMSLTNILSPTNPKDGSTTDPMNPSPRAVEGNTSYCAPEVLRLVLPKSRFRRNKGYSHLCDYWSVGVAIYNLLYGRLPFESDAEGCVMDKVLHFRKTLVFHDDANVSCLAVNLLKGLLCKAKQRLGLHGLPEVQKHAWFSTIEWSSLGQGTVSKPITLQELERYRRTEENAMTSSGLLGVRGSIGNAARDATSGEDSDEEELQELEDIKVKTQIPLDFNVPLCDDPTVPKVEPSSSSGATSNEMLSRWSDTARKDRFSRQQAHEATYTQRLIAWFTSGIGRYKCDDLADIERNKSVEL